MNFTNLDLEANFDSLYIHNGTSTASPILGAYTGTTNPGAVTANSGSITLHFVSDPFVNNSGFAATWTCQQVSTGVSENGGLSGVTIYPNPANGSAELHYLLSISGPVQILLTDMLGREISLFESAIQSAGEHTLSIDLNALALQVGIYDVRIMAPGGNENIKLIVK